jgi:hypothetical protein
LEAGFPVEARLQLYFILSLLFSKKHIIFAKNLNYENMQTNMFQLNNKVYDTSSYQKRKEEEGWMRVSEAPYSTHNECLENAVTIDECIEAVSNHIYEYFEKKTAS